LLFLFSLFTFIRSIAVVCVLIQKENRSFFSSLYHLLFDIVYVSHSLFFVLLLVVVVVLESKQKKSFNKKDTPFIFSRKFSTLLLYPYSVSFHFFLYSNPCFFLSLFLPYLQTIHLNVRLSLRNKQKIQSSSSIYDRSYISDQSCRLEMNNNYFPNV
jgi:hypothetical protein